MATVFPGLPLAVRRGRKEGVSAAKPPSRWDASQILARGILKDRELRRRMMFRLGMLMMGMVAVGQWGIDGWLQDRLWRFAAWWGGCAVVTVWVILLAIYDALRVVKEIREEESGD